MVVRVWPDMVVVPDMAVVLDIVVVPDMHHKILICDQATKAVDMIKIGIMDKDGHMRDQNGQNDQNTMTKLAATVVAAMVAIEEAAVAHMAMMIQISVHGIKLIGKIITQIITLNMFGLRFIHSVLV